MESKKVMGLACLFGLLLNAQMGRAQVTQLGNLVNSPIPYVGCDINSNQPLRFSTLANFPHEWRTANLLRMRLNPTQTYGTLNGYLNVNADGNLLISPINNFMASAVGPFTRLHLLDLCSTIQRMSGGPFRAAALLLFRKLCLPTPCSSSGT